MHFSSSLLSVYMASVSVFMHCLVKLSDINILMECCAKKVYQSGRLDTVFIICAFVFAPLFSLNGYEEAFI